MNEIARFLQGVWAGGRLDLLVPTSVVAAIVINVFLSEPIKELRERVLRGRSLKKEVELLKAEIIKSLKREGEATECAERYRALLERTIVHNNEMQWQGLQKSRKILELEREMMRFRFKRPPGNPPVLDA